jgi:hypothetical protein
VTLLKNGNTTVGVTYSSLTDTLEEITDSLFVNIRSYAGLDDTGTTDMASIINQASSDAAALAVSSGCRFVTLGGFGRGIYRVDTSLRLRDKVVFDLGECQIRLGADLVALSALFQAVETQTAATAQGTGTTANTSKVITSVTSPELFAEGDWITGTGIPANTFVNGVDIENERLILSKAATGSATVTLTKAATYYGSFRNGGIIGGEINPNGYAIGEHIRAHWTENFVIEGTRLRHDTRKAGDEDWALNVGGRDLLVKDVEVVGGKLVFQDGVHIAHGQRIRVIGCSSESGDDAYAIGNEMFTSMIAQADPIRGVTLQGNVAKSNRGFALKVYVPVPSAGALANGWTAADYGVTDVVCDGLTGYSGRLRNGGIGLIDVAAGVVVKDNIRGVSGVSLDVGGPGNDGANAWGVWSQSATDVTVSGTIKVVDGEGSIDTSAGALGGAFRGVYIRDSDDVNVAVNNLNSSSLSYGVEVRASTRVKIGGKFKQTSTSVKSAVFIRDSTVEVNMDLIDVQDTLDGITVDKIAVNSAVQVTGGKIAHEAGATTGEAVAAAQASIDSFWLDNVDLTGAVAPFTAVASAANIKPLGAVTAVSGTADVTSVTATGYGGRTVTLVFTGTAATNGLVDGSNLKLSANLAYTPNDAITLVCDGTNWYETGRSVS